MLIRSYFVLFSILLVINFNSYSMTDGNPAESPRTPRRNLLESPQSSPFMDPVVKRSPESVIYMASKEVLRKCFLTSLKNECILYGTINTEEKLHNFLVKFRTAHLKIWDRPNEPLSNFMDILDVKWEGSHVTIAGQPLPKVNPLPQPAFNAMLRSLWGEPQAAPDDRRAVMAPWPVYPVSTDRKEAGIDPAEATPAHPQPSSEKVDPSESEAESEQSELSKTFLINPSQRAREVRAFFNGSRETLVPGSHTDFERLSATGPFPFTPENPAAPLPVKAFCEKRPRSCASHLLRKAYRQKRPRSSMN